jgi:nucleotide-binding universal stress UspA family protein
MYHRILVPINGSDAAGQGVAEAIRLAKPWGSTLRLLHVICTYPAVVAMANRADLEGYRRSLEERAVHLLEASAALTRNSGVAVETHSRELGRGRVSSAILEEASSSDCDLIVMGTHGRSGLARTGACCNAEEVVRQSATPVLVVRRANVAQRAVGYVPLHHRR